VREGARFVARFLEREPVSGNHYWSNGLGLWYAGAFLGRRGAGFARLGRRITLGQLAAQVRPDGVSIECSTGYHRLVTELMFHALRLLQLEGRPVPAQVPDRVRRMVRFAAETMHPGGRAAQLGDHDDGRVLSFAPRPPLDHRHLLAVGAVLLDEPAWLPEGRAAMDEAAWLVGRGALSGASRTVEGTLDVGVGPGSGREPGVAFPEGGVYVLRAGEVHSVWDAGPLAKPGNGVHGHADTLSGEVSVAGVPVLVDSGTYAYTGDPAGRNRLRGTAAHNVVQVDGLEMAEPGTGPDLWWFGNDVPCRVRRFGPDGEAVVLEAAHEGYRERGVQVTVRRTVRLLLSGERMDVTDTIEGTGRHRAALRWHLAPLPWILQADGSVRACAGRREVTLAVRAGRCPGGVGPRPHLANGDFSERWGELRVAPILELELEGDLPIIFETTLTLRADGAP
jgi:hypothetical protein